MHSKFCGFFGNFHIQKKRRLCICVALARHSPFVLLSVDEHLRYFHFFGLFWRMPLWTVVFRLLWTCVLNFGGHIAQSGITGSYGKSMSNILRTWQTFPKGSAQFTAISGVPVSLSVCRCFIMFAVLGGVQWHLFVALIGISLMPNDVEHLFKCLLIICVSFLEKYLFRSSPRF